jgi:hypothetical protein
MLISIIKALRIKLSLELVPLGFLRNKCRHSILTYRNNLMNRNNNNNNNNHGSTALYGLGPPLASSFRGY